MNKTDKRWTTAYAQVAKELTKNERIQRGESLRQIKARVPKVVGLEKLSLRDLEDVKLSMHVCEINRIVYNRNF